jgi:hypothetical protein
VEKGERVGGGVQVGVTGRDWLAGWEDRRIDNSRKYLEKAQID